MRRLVLLAALLAASCAPTPKPAPVVAKPTTVREHGDLIGLTASALVQRFGKPGFQVREGPGIKLQWTSGGCVLDAYLYPRAGGSGGETVTHIDTRRPSGEAAPRAACVAALSAY